MDGTAPAGTLPTLDGLAARLAAEEATVPALRPGCASHVVWAGTPGTRTDLAILYLHGFSASPNELTPVPQLAAAELGANLYLPRLTGHGQDGPALGRATFADWRRDTARALQIAALLGDRVLVIGCSTGATLLALALAEGADVAGAVFVAPNFALRSRMAQGLLDLPASGHWVPWLIGRQRSFEVVSPQHAAWWTPCYPTRAAAHVGAAIRAVRHADLASVRTPALFAFCDGDQVVDAAATHRVMARWGGPVTHLPMVMGPGDDARCHVVAGDVFSPRQSAPLATAIADFARRL